MEKMLAELEALVASWAFRGESIPSVCAVLAEGLLRMTPHGHEVRIESEHSPGHYVIIQRGERGERKIG